jgi:hypothetical protein
VSIDVPKGRMAISNMPIAQVTSLSATTQRVRFQQTPKMSHDHHVGESEIRRHCLEELAQRLDTACRCADSNYSNASRDPGFVGFIVAGHAVSRDGPYEGSAVAQQIVHCL